MFQGIRSWWANHSHGEQRFMTVLGIIIAIVFLWLGIWRPLNSGIAAGWERQGAALDRYASVRSKVAELQKRPAQRRQANRVPIEQFIGQSAAEAGFTLDRATQQGQGRISINIASAKVGPLFQWISTLEGAGISVQTISIAPGGTEGAVAMQGVFQEAAP